MALLGLAAAALALASPFALTQTPPIITPDDLARIARNVAEAAVAKYGSQHLEADQLGVTIALLDRPSKRYVAGSYRGDIDMYPASVVKMFYLAYTAHLLRERKLRMTPELERGVKDMIVESVNDATALVLDTITGTTGGPELGPKELQKWMEKRQAVNRWFSSLGYPKLNACQKTWNEGPYGRERQGYGPNSELRNSLSPDVCVHLMADIALDKIVDPERCAWMKGYLSRTIVADGQEADEQSRLFSGKVLPSGTKLWSKAGWTSTVRHDVAYVLLPDGREFVYALFTKGHSDNGDLVPFMATEMLKGLGALK